MSQQFNQVRVGNSARSTFDLSHHQVTTTDFGYLIPICCRDLVPNDDIVCKPSLFVRLAPLAFPVYGKITCRVHSFFVPYRLLFPHWDEFLVQSDSNHSIPPYFLFGTLQEILDLDPQFGSGTSIDRGFYGRVLANLGVDPSIFKSGSGVSTSDRLLAFRSLAYYRIWLDWFMDSSLTDHSVQVAAFNEAVKNGGSLTGNFAKSVLRYRCACFGKDYFTTAKLHPQAGSQPSKVVTDLVSADVNPGLVRPASGLANIGINPDGTVRSASGSPVTSNSSLASFTVEELRAAVSLQRYLERNNYVGTKVINQLLAHFGVAPTPERIDMSEFLGGSNFNIQVGDVTSTTPNGSESVETIGLGAQAGKAVGASQTETIRYHAKEHGVFMTLLSVLPDTAYYQGIPKEFQLGVTGDPLDFYTPEFENLGYQEILNKEVYVPIDADTRYQSYDPEGIFGYAPRYAFLKWQHDVLGGDFVGNLTSSQVMGANMDAWHLFRKFVYDDQDDLALNQNFVQCDNHDTDYDRIFQVTNKQLDHFYFNIDVDFKSTRNMVGFAEPSLDSVNMEDGNKITLPYGGTRL